MGHLWIPSFIVAADFCLRLYFCLNIIGRKLPVGTTWAWLGLILMLPVAGTILYLYLGEYRVGPRRSARIAAACHTIDAQVREMGLGIGQVPIPEESGRSLALTVFSLFQSPILGHNTIRLLPDADASFPVLLADIHAAQHSIDLEFFIWSDGGRADTVAEALITARGRGVRCRVLVDGIGSAAFLRGKVARGLRHAGVELQTALPAGLFRSLFTRPDLRLHRKIVVIDGATAYTGSLNLADPAFFKRSAGVGPWVDAFCRVQGPAVRALHLVFLSDWSAETGADLAVLEQDSPFQDLGQAGPAAIQCVASGPALGGPAIEETIVAAIYAARRSLTLTTPYFLPSDTLLYALTAAARRQVAVTLIVPEHVDSWLTQHASHTYFKELLDAGVRVALFQGGLLHTKSLVVDDAYAIFGSLNLDPRSLRINFEISLVVYDPAFAGLLAGLQGSYLGRSRMLSGDAAGKVGMVERIKEGVARLAGPLL